MAQPGPRRRADDATVGSEQWWADQGRRREPLSTGRIVEAAVRIIEVEGPDALTMRRVADELGTAAASLYRHVESRDALVLLVGEAILAEVRLPEREASWQERTVDYAYAVRRALGRHPGRATFVLGPHTPAPEAFELFRSGVQVYLDAGFPPEVALAAAQAVLFLVRSFVVVETDWPESLLVAPEALVPSVAERFEDARRIDGAEAERPADEMFDFLLGSLIDGLERRLTEVGSAGRGPRPDPADRGT